MRNRGNITSSSGRCHDRSVTWTQELRGEARLETVSEPSQAGGKFRTAGRRSYPEGTAATAQTRTQTRFPAGRPRQKARIGKNDPGAQGRRVGGERAGQANPAKTPQLGGV